MVKYPWFVRQILPNKYAIYDSSNVKRKAGVEYPDLSLSSVYNG